MHQKRDLFRVLVTVYPKRTRGKRMNKEKRRGYVITGLGFMIISGLVLTILNPYDIVVWFAFFAGLAGVILA